MKWIVLAGFTGWAAIVALAWWLADRRLGSMCQRLEQYCNPALVAQRDAILTGGLTVALVAALAVAVIALRSKRLSGQSANQVQRPQRLR